MTTDDDKIITILKNDANRRAKSGDKRGARIIRNAVALIYSNTAATPPIEPK